MKIKIILIVIWIFILLPSYLFPKWTYIQIKTNDNKSILLKYEAPRSFRFNKPPLDIDYTTPGWHGLKEPMSFDIVEVENNWMLLEWLVITIIYFLFLKRNGYIMDKKYHS